MQPPGYYGPQSYPPYPPPQQHGGRPTVPLPGSPMSGAPLPGAPSPAFPPPPQPQRRGLAPLIVGFVIAVVVVGLVTAAIGYQVGYGVGFDRAAASNTAGKTTAGKTSDGAQQPSKKAEGTLTGSWRGSYTCGQGQEGMSLVLSGPDNAINATFEFFPLADAPQGATGSFRLKGTYASGKLDLKADSWINQPSGYSMVDLSATKTTAKQIDGTVDGSGCSTFTVKKS